MNKLSRADRIQILHTLVEGNSLRSTSRLCGVSINTVTKLLVDAGRVALAYQNEKLTDLPCKKIQCDEIWAFVGMKDAHIPEERKGEDGIGSVWTWVAICADTKLVPTFMIGRRDADAAHSLMLDLASRLTSRIQLTTDGHAPYLKAVDGAFGLDVDYAMLIKQYGAPTGNTAQERRYSPGDCTGIRTEVITGAPSAEDINTAYVERQNLTMRMSMRRFTRLTNGFSKKEENLCHAVALHFWFYNFARIHKTLKRTPAMAAGVTDKRMDLGDLVDLIAADEETAAQVAIRRKDRRGSN